MQVNIYGTTFECEGNLPIIDKLNFLLELAKDVEEAKKITRDLEEDPTDYCRPNSY